MELFSRETTVTHRVIENIQSLSVTEELDTPPTVKELSKVIDSLANNKAPGKDSIIKAATFMNYCFSVGKREMCPKICVMPTLLRFTKIKVNAVTANIIEAYPYCLCQCCPEEVAVARTTGLP